MLNQDDKIKLGRKFWGGAVKKTWQEPEFDKKPMVMFESGEFKPIAEIGIFIDPKEPLDPKGYDGEENRFTPIFTMDQTIAIAIGSCMIGIILGLLLSIPMK